MSKPKLTWQKFILQLRNPFRLSYGVSETRQAYWLRLTDDAGWGEGTIPPYYGVKDADMEALMRMKHEAQGPHVQARQPEQVAVVQISTGALGWKRLVLRKNVPAQPQPAN